MVGNLPRISDLYPMDIETALANYNILPEEEISPAASFISSCLQLNSSDSLSFIEDLFNKHMLYIECD